MKKHILIVDDEEFLLNSMLRDLRKLGEIYVIQVTKESKRVIDIIREGKIDLVITDIFMPDKEGIELIREIRRDFPAVKIISMSGQGVIGEVDYLELTGKLGTSFQLQKPFTKEELVSAIHHVLDCHD